MISVVPGPRERKVKKQWLVPRRLVPFQKRQVCLRDLGREDSIKQASSSPRKGTETEGQPDRKSVGQTGHKQGVQLPRTHSW